MAVLNILVGEKDRDQRNFYRGYEQLHPDQVKFHLTSNGRSFLAYAKSHYSSIDGAISNCRMPLLSGIEAIEALEEEGIKIPTAMITAGDDLDIEARAKKAGVAGYFTKGEVDPFYLIEQAVQRIRARKQSAERNSRVKSSN